MRYVTILILVLSSQLLNAQSFYVEGKGYKGYAFDKDHFVFMSIENQKERYTPRQIDISVVEQLLKDSIDYIMKDQNDCSKQEINKHTIKKYRRQYVGFITKDNEIIIWINFLKKDRNFSNKDLSRDIVSVLDGGCNFWSISVNLTKRKLFNLHINGVG